MEKNIEKKKYITKDAEELKPIAVNLLRSFPQNKIFLFYGDLGAGKTTLIKNLCLLLGVTDTMSSPSFSIINEYKTGSDQTIYHFDLYRLKTVDEIYDIGYEDYIYSDSYCFIEWPEKIESLLPQDIVRVYLRINQEDNSRIIRF